MRKNGRKEFIKTALLLTPVSLLFLILCYAGISALVQSFGYIPAFNLNEITFKYYRELFQDQSFKASLLFSIKSAFFSAAVSTVAGTAVCAAFLAFKGRRRSFLILRLPILIPHTVTAIFSLIFFAKSGIIARLLYQAGLISGQEAFSNILYSQSGLGIILAYLWKEIPFVAYFCFALMSSVSESLAEAARNMGASKYRAFFNVTLPLTLAAAAKAFIILFAYSFGAYELPFLLGPTLPKALPVKAYLEYTHPDLKHKPYAMAMNGIILFFSLIFALLYYFLLLKQIKKINEGKAVDR